MLLSMGKQTNRSITLFLKLFSKEGALVVDPFLGSGTTALACKNTKRKCIGIELNEEYYKVALERLK